jgi:transposase-like protein
LVEHPLSTIRLYREKWIRDKFNVERETLVRLHFDEGVTNKELAKRFNVSVTTIKVKLYGYQSGNQQLAKIKIDTVLYR